MIGLLKELEWAAFPLLGTGSASTPKTANILDYSQQIRLGNLVSADVCAIGLYQKHTLNKPRLQTPLTPLCGSLGGRQ